MRKLLFLALASALALPALARNRDADEAPAALTARHSI
jgi:hypothetical protein